MVFSFIMMVFFLIRDVKLLCPIVSSLHYVVFLLCCWDIIWRDVALRLCYGLFNTLCY